MAKGNLIQVRVDEELRRDVDALFKHLGLDVASAVRLFLRQAVIHGCIPFPITKARGFFNERNQLVLRESIDQLNRGEGKAHDLVEADHE